MIDPPGAKLARALSPALKPMKGRRKLEILPQPNDSTCGPTCLHAVYRYHGDRVDLDSVIEEVTPLESGGTLGVWLACHALKRGYQAKIYTYNLQIFDPTWFWDVVHLPAKLAEQARVKRSKKLRFATQAYLDFLELGGELAFQELTPALLEYHLRQGQPILTGLSSTYLYGCARETPADYDDIAGEPQGHFVVLCGYDSKKAQVLVADPLGDNPRFAGHYYSVGIDRLIGAILLGILTYDANLLLLDPPEAGRALRK